MFHRFTCVDLNFWGGCWLVLVVFFVWGFGFVLFGVFCCFLFPSRVMQFWGRKESQLCRHFVWLCVQTAVVLAPMFFPGAGLASLGNDGSPPAESRPQAPSP